MSERSEWNRMEDDALIFDSWTRQILDRWRAQTSARMEEMVERHRQIASQHMEDRAIYQELLWRRNSATG